MNAFLEKLRMYDLRTTFSYAASEIRNRTFTRYIKRSYSQTGEDLFIDGLLGYKKTGFYVDVGAGDPVRFNNTRRFYRKGWNGINIEPNLKLYQRLCADRERDINLNIGIGRDASEKTFFRFIPDTLSTFSADEMDRYRKQGYRLVESQEMELRRLDSVLSEYRGDGGIDFLSVDTKGYDLDVLESNDWSRFKPTAVCIESVRHRDDDAGDENHAGCERLLLKNHYRKAHDNGLNSIFILKDYDGTLTTSGNR